jgi:hypothetical protein
MIERITKTTRTDWRTPKEIIDFVVTVYRDQPFCDPFPATDPAHHFANYNLADGLTYGWSANAYVNPPYGSSSIMPCITAARHEFFQGRSSQQIWLVPARAMDTRWWIELSSFSRVFTVPSRRLKFEGAAQGAQFPSALVYIGYRPFIFTQEVRRRGWKNYWIEG